MVAMALKPGRNQIGLRGVRRESGLQPDRSLDPLIQKFMDDDMVVRLITLLGSSLESNMSFSVSRVDCALHLRQRPKGSPRRCQWREVTAGLCGLTASGGASSKPLLHQLTLKSAQLCMPLS
jgi:hypothetical protein